MVIMMKVVWTRPSDQEGVGVNFDDGQDVDDCDDDDDEDGLVHLG